MPQGSGRRYGPTRIDQPGSTGAYRLAIDETAARQIIPRPATWRPGATPGWSQVDPAELTIDRIGSALSGRVGRTNQLAAPDARSSAVLVAVVDDPAGPQLLLTRRSWALRDHRGEVSFPGGGRDPDDVDLVQTALREAREEVGLDSGVVRIVGELDHLVTVSSDRFVVPVVGIASSIDGLVAQPTEVEAILVVPAARLLEPGVHHEEIWRREIDGVTIEHPIQFFDIPGDIIWGATAAMIHQLFELALGKD